MAIDGELRRYGDAASDVADVRCPAGDRGSYARNSRTIWEPIYNHYVVLKHMKATYAALVRPEGGGGDYGPNSGGFDALGYGTLTFSLAPAKVESK